MAPEQVAPTYQQGSPISIPISVAIAKPGFECKPVSMTVTLAATNQIYIHIYIYIWVGIAEHGAKMTAGAMTERHRVIKRRWQKKQESVK